MARGSRQGASSNLSNHVAFHATLDDGGCALHEAGTAFPVCVPRGGDTGGSLGRGTEEAPSPLALPARTLQGEDAARATPQERSDAGHGVDEGGAGSGLERGAEEAPPALALPQEKGHGPRRATGAPRGRPWGGMKGAHGLAGPDPSERGNL